MRRWVRGAGYLRGWWASARARCAWSRETDGPYGVFYASGRCDSSSGGVGAQVRKNRWSTIRSGQIEWSSATVDKGGVAHAAASRRSDDDFFAFAPSHVVPNPSPPVMNCSHLSIADLPQEPMLL